MWKKPKRELLPIKPKTFKRSTESPVIVNVLDAKTIEMIQAKTLSEGLSFQPGLRMEVNWTT